MQALVFDFDGLIIDSETPDYEAWRDIYKDYGAMLPLDLWTSFIGLSTAETAFDPYAYLEAQIGQPVDHDVVREQRRARYMELFLHQPLLPGVMNYLDEARRLNLKLAVASSGTTPWIRGNLERLDLIDYFDTVCCTEDVPRAKPDPALYQLALARIGVPPQQAIALEDSPNGLTAAKRAGLFAVAVPNTMTSLLNLAHADLRLNSLADLPLADLLEKAAQRQAL